MGGGIGGCAFGDGGYFRVMKERAKSESVVTSFLKGMGSVTMLFPPADMGRLHVPHGIPFRSREIGRHFAGTAKHVMSAYEKKVSSIERK